MPEIPVSTEQKQHLRSRVSILLVDDDADFACRLKDMLSRHLEQDALLDHVDSLAGAFSRLDEFYYDLILLDLNLPDSTGVNTPIMLIQQALDTPVIVVAADDDVSLAWESMDYGVQNVLLRSQLLPRVVLPMFNHAIRQHEMQLTLEKHIRELELTNGRFLSLVADNADAIVVVDQVGVVRFVNPSAERLLNYSAADLIGQMFGVPLEGVENTEIDILTGHIGGKTAEIRVMRTLWDGERAYIVTMRDITERKQTERALRIAKQSAEQASAMKTQFLANMSHELRTPLNSIIGFSDMMRMGVAGPILPHKYGEYINDIHRCGTHLLSLINDLLDLSKAETEMLSIYEERFDLATTADAAAELMAPQATERKVDLVVSSTPKEIWVNADERMVRQVILNLVSNAIKFTPERGLVSLEVARTVKDETRIVVRDTGIGIPGEQIPRAFVAFVQVENAYNRTEAQGTGLGLALSKRFVELHQGTIKIESEENVGTVVTVVLPSERAVDPPDEEQSDDVVSLQASTPVRAIGRSN